MKLASSRVTAQGQISVPASVREKLGIRPGSVVEWHGQGRNVIVRRTGRYTFDDIHRALFPGGPPPRKSLAELKEAIREDVRKRFARG